MPVDPAQYKSAASMFASGVTIVTTAEGEDLYGIAVSAFCSLSIDPLQVMVSIARSSTLHDMIHRSQKFGVSILRREQQFVSEYFSSAGRSPIRGAFPGIEHETHATGSPIIKGALAHFDCRVAQEYDGGDHTIYVGSVESADADREGWPLLYFKGAYRGVEQS